MRQAAEGKSSCDVRAVISRWGEVGTLSGEAVEVDFLCLEPLALDFSHDGERPDFLPLQAEPPLPSCFGPQLALEKA